MLREDPEFRFERHVAEPRGHLVGELVAFVREHKKWWLGPIILAMLVMTLFVLLGGTAAAPFIYTLF